MSHPRSGSPGGPAGEGMDAAPSQDQECPSPRADSGHRRLGRRLLVTRVLTGAVVLMGASLAPLREAQAQYRTGLTDSDPNDSPGYGRGQRRPRTGLTDADPNDGAGYGRGGNRGGNRRHTGLTDADPNDGAGYGRGGGRRRTGLTDSDPSDGAGYGRGGWR